MAWCRPGEKPLSESMITGDSNPQFRIYDECSNHLSYRGQTFPILCFGRLELAILILLFANLKFEIPTLCGKQHSFLTHKWMFLGKEFPDSKVHGANIGPHVCPINRAVRVIMRIDRRPHFEGNVSHFLLALCPLIFPHRYEYIQWCFTVTMSAMASQLTRISSVCSTVCSGPDQGKHQSSASLAFLRVVHRWPVDFPQTGPVTQKMFPFDDVIMDHVPTRTPTWPFFPHFSLLLIFKV